MSEMLIDTDLLHTISGISIFWLGQISVAMVLLTGFSFNAAIRLMTSSDQCLADDIAALFIFSSVFMFLATIFVMGDMASLKQASIESSKALANSYFDKAGKLAKISISFAFMGVISLFAGVVKLAFSRSIKLAGSAVVATIIAIIGFAYFVKLFSI